MSKYTLELRYIYEDKKFNLFDFPYNLYDNELKPLFEEKFFQHFMFHEIGFDSVAMFKQRLMSKLNDIYPYYKQLYETELACKEIESMEEIHIQHQTKYRNYFRMLENKINNIVVSGGGLTENQVQNLICLIFLITYMIMI